MSFIKYLKDKLLYVFIYFISILFTYMILNIFNFNRVALLVIICINLFTGLFIFIFSYYKKSKFYKCFINNLNNLDKKYYIIETLPLPSSYEEEIIYNSLYEINKSMIENINSISSDIIDFKEFIELWVHEVKMPISSLLLKCHNNNINGDFVNEIKRLDNYVEKVLYYVRSENAYKDFSISRVSLKSVIKSVLINNQSFIVDSKIDVKVDIDEVYVYTDSKWLEFIINQIVSNSIKYKKNNSKIIISSFVDNDSVILKIYDNGLGIDKKNIDRVFEKSFTGRKSLKSTGMGLFIAYNLCNKLGHKISIDSVINKYTEVSISFYNNKYYNVTKM